MTARRRCHILLLLCGIVSLPAAAQPLVAEGEIALPGVHGRIDHLALDPQRRRLLVAELGNNTVDIVDLAGGRVTNRIAGLAEPQGVGFAPKADRYAVANANDGTVHFYRAEDLAPAETVELGSDADNVRIDPANGGVLVGYGSGGIAAIDLATLTKTGAVALPAHPEGFQLDPAGARLYVNLPEAHRIAVIDRAAGKIVANWNTGALGGNFPMAIDETGGLVAAVFRNPSTLVVYDSKSGEVRTQLPTCGDADDAFFDDKRKRIYVSCGAGMVDVFEAEASGYRPLGQVATASGARTSLFVPALDRLFVAVRAGTFGGSASIQIFRPAP
jgi:DNA-binding beta-propeller fold protein YncE